MNDKNTGTMDIKARLSTLWIFIMFNMAFADILGFIRPGFLKDLEAGYAGAVRITPEFLLIAAVCLEIPIAMIVLSRLLKRGANRRANIIAGIFTIVFVTAGGTTALYYIFFASVEVVCSLIIIWLAWKWHNPEAQP